MGIGRGVYGGIMRRISHELKVCDIECAPLKEQFGCDITCGIDLILQEGQPICKEGEVIRFELSPHMLPGAKPQAMSVTKVNQVTYIKPKQQKGGKGREKGDSRQFDDDP